MKAVGRRKSAVARVYLKKGNGGVIVNGKDYKEYFPVTHLKLKIEEPFTCLGIEDQFEVVALITGGGVKGQAEALSLGISRALIKYDAASRPKLKAGRLLTRDARVVERKKAGYRKARKKEQYSKR